MACRKPELSKNNYFFPVVRTIVNVIIIHVFITISILLFISLFNKTKMY